MSTTEVEKKAPSRAQTLAWAAFILLGWAVFAYLALATPGGLPAAWSWVRSLPLVIELIVWLLLLPWMIALWISQTTWPAALKILLIAGLALATLWISIPPLIRLLAGRR